jgi:hypothetical protein
MTRTKTQAGANDKAPAQSTQRRKHTGATSATSAALAVVEREVVNALESARHMKFALDFLALETLEHTDTIPLSGGVTAGLQNISWYLHDQLGSVLGAVSPIHAAEMKESASATHPGHAKQNAEALMHLLMSYVIVDVRDRWSKALADSIEVGLVELKGFVNRSLKNEDKESGAGEPSITRVANHTLPAGLAAEVNTMGPKLRALRERMLATGMDLDAVDEVTAEVLNGGAR